MLVTSKKRRWRRFKKGRRKYGREGKKRLIVSEKRMESVEVRGIGLQWKRKAINRN